MGEGIDLDDLQGFLIGLQGGFVRVVRVLKRDSVGEPLLHPLLHVAPLHQPNAPVDELLVPQHIGEGLTEEAQLEVHGEVAILVLSESLVYLVLALDDEGDHLVVKEHILGDILLLVEYLNGLLEKLCLSEELLHFLQVV